MEKSILGIKCGLSLLLATVMGYFNDGLMSFCFMLCMLLIIVDIVVGVVYSNMAKTFASHVIREGCFRKLAEVFVLIVAAGFDTIAVNAIPAYVNIMGGNVIKIIFISMLLLQEVSSILEFIALFYGLSGNETPEKFSWLLKGFAVANKGINRSGASLLTLLLKLLQSKLTDAISGIDTSQKSGNVSDEDISNTDLEGDI